MPIRVCSGRSPRGGRLSCVSAATLQGWWTPENPHTHVVLPPTASRVSGDDLRLHWAIGPEPIGRAALIDPAVNVLFQVARCLPLADALPVWESAIRLRAVEPSLLARVQWRSEPAQRLAAEASRLSDSGVETSFVLLMRSIDVTVRQQVLIDGHRVDGLIGLHLITQIDGFAHHRAADRRRDIRADARLALRGYTVLRFDYYQVLFEPEAVIATVAAAMAQGLHR